jgi:hypothetical protein
MIEGGGWTQWCGTTSPLVGSAELGVLSPEPLLCTEQGTAVEQLENSLWDTSHNNMPF